jgi:hypothetical protein
MKNFIAVPRWVVFFYAKEKRYLLLFKKNLTDRRREKRAFELRLAFLSRPGGRSYNVRSRKKQRHS